MSYFFHNIMGIYVCVYLESLCIHMHSYKYKHAHIQTHRHLLHSASKIKYK